MYTSYPKEKKRKIASMVQDLIQEDKTIRVRPNPNQKGWVIIEWGEHAHTMYDSTRQPSPVTDPSSCRHDWKETCMSGIKAICTRCGSWKIAPSDSFEEREHSKLF